MKSMIFSEDSSMKKFLTDSYAKWGKTPVDFGGQSENAPAMAEKVLARLPVKEGGASVIFLPLCEEATAMVKSAFGDVYKKDTNEGFVLVVAADRIMVYADCLASKLAAVYSLLAHSKEGLREGIVYSRPSVEHRSIRFYLPAREGFPFFKELMELLAALGYNAVILEIGAAMELKRHPELNAYWLAYSKSMNSVRNKRYLASDLNPRMRNSTHTFNANGEVLSQAEVRELVDYGHSLGLEMIPEVPSLSHSEHILGCYPELAEDSAEEAPTCACPQNEKLYEIVFDLYDEAIEVFDAKMVHMAHDEWWVYCVCDKCKDKDPGELFAYNVNKCYDYLRSKGVKAAIWADSLVGIQDRVTGEVHGAFHKPAYTVKTDKVMELMGKMLPLYQHEWTPDMSKLWPENALDATMKDRTKSFSLVNPEIKLWNWYYGGNTEIRDPFLADGRYAVYGNYGPMRTAKWQQRMAAGIRGFSISNWLESTREETMRWGCIADLAYGALQAYDPAFADEDFKENFLLCAEWLYWFYNRETLLGAHVEITHTFTGKPFDNEDAEPAGDLSLLGYYRVIYENGTYDRIPVHTDYNVGPRDASLSLEENPHSYNMYKGVNKHLWRTLSAACVTVEEDGIYYTFAIPTKAAVKEVVYEPIKNPHSIVIKNIAVK